MQKIFFSCFGTTDPVRGMRDGGMLHILRFYRPEAVYLFLSREIAELDRADQRIEKTFAYLQENWDGYCPEVIRQETDISDPSDMDILLEPMQALFQRAATEHPEAEILINLSSGTPQMQVILAQLALDENEREMLEHIVLQMEAERGLDRSAAIADMRFDFIERLCEQTVIKPRESRERIRSEKIDRILTGKYTAMPTFLLVMLLTFYLTFNVVGKWLSDLLQLGIDALTGVVDAALTAYGINPVVHSLIIDGIFAGVGSVLVFLPIIVTLFFFLSILEDTGYMARVAFVMDKPLRKIGLSGRSIVPMLIGFGCSVPAIMATRTVSSDRDRKMTILLTPYMSCSAKISIYAFFTAAFFPAHRALVMISLYLLGILIGILAALIMNKTAFRGKPVPFVMELPNYRMPGLKSVALLLWEKAKDFLQRAFTVIFLATIIIWFLQSFDTRLNVVSDSAQSLLALIGKGIAPIFAPLGFADWRCATSLISGFIAKESVVSTLEVLLGGTAIASLFTTRSAVSFLVFTLLYTPCVAAVATIRRELNSTF